MGKTSWRENEKAQFGTKIIDSLWDGDVGLGFSLRGVHVTPKWKYWGVIKNRFGAQETEVRAFVSQDELGYDVVKMKISVTYDNKGSFLPHSAIFCRPTGVLRSL